MTRVDGKVYALKRIKIGGLDEKDKKNSLNEVRILASLSHQNIVGILGLREPTVTPSSTTA